MVALTFLLAPLGCTAPGTMQQQPTDPWDPDAPLGERCFGDLGPGAIIPAYDAYEPVVPRHCLGTDHQDIDEVGKLVFLGDSITAGTPPTPFDGLFRNLLAAELTERFGPLEVANCAEWGAEIDDLLPDRDQIGRCIAEVEPLPVLVVFTIGGNDMVGFGDDLNSGLPLADVEASFQGAIDELDTVLHWFRDEEARGRFPAGVDVVFGNVYEYTDGTGDVSSCELAELFGVSGTVPEFREGYAALNEAYLRLAVETDTDMIFLFEHFCGHGTYHDDPTNPCYRGPNAEMWFDFTCIHPTEAGHRQIADMIAAVVDE